MRHDETPLQIFTAQPTGAPVPILRSARRRDMTIPLRSQPLPPADPAPPPASRVPFPVPVQTATGTPRDPAADTVSAAGPSAFDAPPARHWADLEAACDRPLRRLWRTLLGWLGITHR